MEKKRIEYIDLAKGICILSVAHLQVVNVLEYFTNNVSYWSTFKLEVQE